MWQLSNLQKMQRQQQNAPRSKDNVPKGIYHTHTLTPGTKVLIVENADTTLSNSPKAMLSQQNREEIIRLSKQLLKPQA